MLSFSTNARSRSLNILHCLALEESAFHKARNTGPEFTLNQKLINKLSSMGHYHVSPYAANSICKAKYPGPSMTFLRLLILEPKSIFKDDINLSVSLKALNKASIDSFKADASKLLFQYLSDIQSLSKDAKCLEKEIPEVKYFWERFRYLETHIGTTAIIDDPEKIVNIFKKLVRIDKILIKCSKASPRR